MSVIVISRDVAMYLLDTSTAFSTASFPVLLTSEMPLGEPPELLYFFIHDAHTSSYPPKPKMPGRSHLQPLPSLYVFHSQILPLLPDMITDQLIQLPSNQLVHGFVRRNVIHIRFHALSLAIFLDRAAEYHIQLRGQVVHCSFDIGHLCYQDCLELAQVSLDAFFDSHDDPFLRAYAHH